LTEIQVNKLFLSLYVRLHLLLNREDGQDLVEYALLVALIALVAVSGVKQVASAVNTSFSRVSTTLG
jgi:pilus assembly protein Flp/PilA